MSRLTAEQARFVTAVATKDLRDSQLEEILRMIEHQAFLGYSRLQTTAFLYKPVVDSLRELGYTVVDLPAYTRISW